MILSRTEGYEGRSSSHLSAEWYAHNVVFHIYRDNEESGMYTRTKNVDLGNTMYGTSKTNLMIGIASLVLELLGVE